MMRRGEGKVQRAIVTWLQKFPDGADTIGIAAGVYFTRRRDAVTRSQKVSVQRALRNLITDGLVEQCPYRSVAGYYCWRLSKAGRRKDT